MATHLGTLTLSIRLERNSAPDSPQGLQKVVGVHEGVDEEVHDDEPPGRSRVLGKGVPAVDEDRHMMIPGSQLAKSRYQSDLTSEEISASVF